MQKQSIDADVINGGNIVTNICRTTGRKGFTLVELMVTVSVLSVMTLVFVGLMMNSLTGWSSAASKDSSTSHVTAALEKICRDVRDAQSAHVSSGMLTVVFPLIKTDSATGEKIYDPTGSDPITRSYYMSGTNLMRRVGTSTSTMIKGIKSVAFSADGSIVSIRLTVSDRMGTRVSDHELTGRVALRNFKS